MRDNITPNSIFAAGQSFHHWLTHITGCYFTLMMICNIPNSREPFTIIYFQLPFSSKSILYCKTTEKMKRQPPSESFFSCPSFVLCQSRSTLPKYSATHKHTYRHRNKLFDGWFNRKFMAKMEKILKRNYICSHGKWKTRHFHPISSLRLFPLFLSLSLHFHIFHERCTHGRVAKKCTNDFPKSKWKFINRITWWLKWKNGARDWCQFTLQMIYFCRIHLMALRSNYTILNRENSANSFYQRISHAKMPTRNFNNVMNSNA